MFVMRSLLFRLVLPLMTSELVYATVEVMSSDVIRMLLLIMPDVPLLSMMFPLLVIEFANVSVLLVSCLRSPCIAIVPYLSWSWVSDILLLMLV